MAREILTRERLAQIPVTPYEELRGNLQTGDLALFVGDELLSRIIQWGTDCPMSHAGIIMVIPSPVDRVMLLEAVGTGVRAAPFSKVIWGQEGERYAGAVFVLRHLEPATVDGLTVASRYALDALTTPYGFGTIVGLGSRILLDIKNQVTQDALICSQYSANWYINAGQHLNLPTMGVETPADLWKDSHFELIARIL